MTARDLGAPFAHNHGVIARVADGVTLETAGAALRSIGPEIDRAYPSKGESVRRSAFAQPLDDARLDPTLRRSVVLLSAAVGCLLLLACANLASLLLARAAERRREMAVRLALGAPGRRLVRQLLTESAVLGLLGAAGAVLIAGWGTRLLGGLAAATAPDALGAQAADLTTITLGTIRIDGAALAFSIALALTTSVVFGFAPALQAARVDVTTALKRGTTGSGQLGRFFNARSALVAAQIALAFALLAGAGLLLRSLDQLQKAPLGFDPAQVLTARLAVPPSASSTTPQNAVTAPFFDSLLQRVSSLPGVTSAAVSSCTPLSTTCEGTRVYLPERPVPLSSAPSVGIQYVSPGYFETLRIPLLEGRSFDDRDRVDSPQVVLVNEEAARLFWPATEAVGRRLHVGTPSEVIGVVANIRRDAIDAPPRPEVYRAFSQSGRSSGFVLLRAETDPLSLTIPLRAQVRSLDPDVPLFDVQTMDDRVGRATVRSRWSTTTMGVFAAMAIVVATIGVYGLIAFVVEQRSREIGIRMALGAAPLDIVVEVLRPAVVLVAAGTVVGLALALSGSRLLESLLYGVQATDALTLAVLPFVLVAAAAVACYRPARRAVKIDPLTVLRAE
jgi:predicted permease